MPNTAQIKEITEQLERGVKELFDSEKYANYLKTMSRFHTYSTRNTLLIHMQRPDASLVAGFASWQTKFGRHVKKGEKAIRIIAPAPFTVRKEEEKLDPETRLPVLGEDGMPVVEYTEQQLARFKVTNVFDVKQTDGKPLPTLIQDLIGNVEQYEAFVDALREVSPLPITIEQLPEDTDGICYYGDRISIREDMSEIQTVSAIIHEIAHAKLHDIDSLRLTDETVMPKDRRTKEVEAESVSYAVCQYFNIETSANSLGYVAEWSKTRELKELNASLDTIRKTSAELIEDIDNKFKQLIQERNITLAVGDEQLDLDKAQVDNSKPPATSPTVIEDNTINKSSANKLYEKFEKLFPQFANNDYNYLKLEAGDGMMPISLEWIFGDRISIMHTYKLNGDLCYDPMMEFRFDNFNKTMSASMYEQSIPPIYQYFDEHSRGAGVDSNGEIYFIPKLQARLDSFASEWLNNISVQGYMPVYGITEIDGEDMRVDFDSDGNPIMPELEQTQIAKADLLLPDPLTTIAELNSFGYTYRDMLPLSNLRAVELFNTGHPIYLLYPDNTEALAMDSDEVRLHSGYCGIERDDWERSHLRLEQSEDSRETDLLYGAEIKFGIYQVSDDIDEARKFRFSSMRELDALGLSVERANYKLVYTAPLTDYDTHKSLAKIFNDYNNESRPADFAGRSVSVSDIIVLQQHGKVSSHYVDTIGFVELDSFLINEYINEISRGNKQPQAYSQLGNSLVEDTGQTINEPKIRGNEMTDELKERLEKVAEFIIEASARETTSGNYITYVEDIPDTLLSSELFSKHTKDIAEIMMGYEAVADIHISDDAALDVCMYLDYCPNFEPLAEEVDDYPEDREILDPLSTKHVAETSFSSTQVNESLTLMERLNKGKLQASEHVSPDKGDKSKYSQEVR